MTTEFHLPNLGEHIDSGEVLSVLVNVGDHVQAEQGVIEVETDKATMEVPCPMAGRVARIHVTEGDTIQVGGLLLTLDADAADEGADSAAAVVEAPPAGKAKPQDAKLSAEAAETAEARQAKKVAEPAAAEAGSNDMQEPAEVAAPPATATSRDPKTNVPGDGHATAPAGPAVRRLARELGVDLTRIAPASGADRLTKEDVLAFVRQTNRKGAGGDAAGEADSDAWGIIRRERLSKIRLTIGERMFQSYSTIPQLTNFDDADISQLERIRQESKEDYARRGVKLTSMPFLVKAVASALKMHPVINASIEPENREIIYKQYVNIGIAVDTERGLIVPVLRDVDTLNIPQIASAMSEQINGVREGNYTVDDLRGGTFTISNLGAVGGSYSTPIINPPEVAILLAGRARKTPLIVDDRVETRLMLPLSLTYDHRLVDGAAAARFLNDLISFLEAPGRLLLAP